MIFRSPRNAARTHAPFLHPTCHTRAQVVPKPPPPHPRASILHPHHAFGASRRVVGQVMHEHKVVTMQNAAKQQLETLAKDRADRKLTACALFVQSNWKSKKGKRGESVVGCAVCERVVERACAICLPASLAPASLHPYRCAPAFTRSPSSLAHPLVHPARPPIRPLCSKHSPTTVSPHRPNRLNQSFHNHLTARTTLPEQASARWKRRCPGLSHSRRSSPNRPGPSKPPRRASHSWWRTTAPRSSSGAWEGLERTCPHQSRA